MPSINNAIVSFIINKEIWHCMVPGNAHARASTCTCKQETLLYLPHRIIYLSWTTGWDFFRALRGRCMYMVGLWNNSFSTSAHGLVGSAGITSCYSQMKAIEPLFYISTIHDGLLHTCTYIIQHSTSINYWQCKIKINETTVEPLIKRCDNYKLKLMWVFCRPGPEEGLVPLMEMYCIGSTLQYTVHYGLNLIMLACIIVFGIQ